MKVYLGGMVDSDVAPYRPSTWRIEVATRAPGHEYFMPELFGDQTERPVKKNLRDLIDAIKHSDVAIILEQPKSISDMLDSSFEFGAARALGVRVWPTIVACDLMDAVHGDPNHDYMRRSEWRHYESLSLAIDRLVHLLSKGVDYKTYIVSDAWRIKAEAAKQRAGQRCQICNRPRTEITLDAHHRTYERLGCELPEDITVLCRDCHELYETNKKSMVGQR